MAATPSGSKPPIPGFLAVSPTIDLGGRRVYQATNTPENWQQPVRQQNEGFKFRDSADRFIASRVEAVENSRLLGPLLGGDRTKIAKFQKVHQDIATEQPRSSTAAMPSINNGPSKPPSITEQPKTEQKTQLSAQAQAFSNQGRAETVGFIDTLLRAVKKDEPFEVAAKKDKKKQSLVNRLYSNALDRRTVKQAPALALHTKEAAIQALESEKLNLPNRRKEQSFDSVRDRSVGIFQSVVPEAKKANRWSLRKLGRG